MIAIRMLFTLTVASSVAGLLIWMGRDAFMAGLGSSLVHRTDKRKEGSCIPKQSWLLDRLTDLVNRSSQIDGCGAGENKTSVNVTAEHFEATAMFQHVESLNSMMNEITFTFDALDVSNRKRREGGDEFRFTFWAYSNATATKTAAIATDLLNGSYKVSLSIPKAYDSYRMTLVHWYTCFDGYRPGCRAMGTSRCEQELSIHNIDFFGPAQVVHSQLLSAIAPYSARSQNSSLLDLNLPTCQASQAGVERVTQSGVWHDDRLNSGTSEISEDAHWVPLCCKVGKTDANPTIFRVGDSTMPRQSSQVGMVFHPDGHYTEWLTYLMNNTNIKKAKESDAMVFQGGLHQIKWSFPPHVGVEILLQMLCQLASVFQGKVIMLGPNPVQQHLYPIVDIRDGQVRLYNALLWKRIVKEHQGSLQSICRSVQIPLDTLIAIREHGQVSTNQTYIRQHVTGMLHNHDVEALRPLLDGADPNKTVKELVRTRLADEADDFTSFLKTPLEERFRRHMINIDYEEVYGNRTVWVTDLHHYLLARDEQYREHDKLHDLRGQFFWDRHYEIITQLTTLRAQGES